MTPLIAKAISIEGRELWFQLKQVYLQEALLRPVFLWGAGLGTGLFVASLLLREGRLRTTALVLMAASGMAVLPYLKLRAKAEAVPAPRDPPVAAVTLLRQDSRWIFVALGTVAVVNLLWAGREKFGSFLTAATLVGGISATVTGLWLEANDLGAMHFSTPSVRVPPAGTGPKPANPPSAPPAAPLGR